MIGAKRQPGFTLIELLITAAIFSTAALLATTVFSNIQTTQRRVQGQQRVNADGRYVVETIARSIRTGNINYAMFANSAITQNSTVDKISTIDQNGSITCYRKNADKVEVATNAAVDCVTNVIWTPFTPDDLQVEALSFFIQPLSDPRRPLPRANTDCAANNYDATKGACTCPSGPSECFSGQDCTTTVPAVGLTPAVKICTNPNVQPHVTIYISTKSKTASVGEQARSSIQTTVVSRLYQ